MARYQRVLVKLSGAAFAGDAEFGIERDAVEMIADELLSMHREQVQLAVMVGGGNIFRGRLAEAWGIDRAEADNIGMMSTVINSLLLRGAIAARGGPEVRVMTAIPINSVAEPYIRLRAIKHLEKGYIVLFAAGTGQPFVTTDYPAVQRAIEINADVILVAKQGVNGVYSADPKQDNNARMYKSSNFDELLTRGITVMDQTAFILARDYRLPIHVFNVTNAGAMRSICIGENVGTFISPEAAITYESSG